MKDIDVSIIIACYNGEKYLDEGITKLYDVLNRTKYTYEFIIVDDKSKDNSLHIAQNIQKKYGNVTLIKHKKNYGRGKTVSDGIKQAKGNIVGFIDIDLEIPAYYILPIIIEVEKGADMATAKRIYKINFREYYVLVRYVTHITYKLLVKMFFRTQLIDTETGCKFFNRAKIIPILSEINDNHWFWDTEIMIRSYYKNLKIKEVPALFIKRTDNSSTLRLWKDSIDYFIKLLRFRKEVNKLKK